ncbi:hypothetical protein GGR51DRAFT_156879 [Nemania sp. FL0031]|nr:hypothetical protein GGR51DRAFT_156879 [Nemania sp. FL0031]
MNWTEGSLARHSRRRQRNALVARQKQHFAKARLNLLGGQPKRGPATISFLTSKLASVTSESPRRAAPPRNHSDAPSSPVPCLKREPRRDHPPYLPDDDYGALPANLDRRKRLLEKSDWAGLRLQKPLNISFPGQVYATKRWTRVARPPERPPKSPELDAEANGEWRSKRLRRSSMRIQIGNQEIQPSITTGSHSSVKRRILEPESPVQTSQHNLISEDSRRAHNPGYARHEHTRVTLDETPRIVRASRSKPETPVNVVYSSSIILEPAPRRNGIFSVLRWSPASSEDRESMQVEVEQPVRPVSSSQESEQQRWKDWVLTEEPSNLPRHSPLTTLEAHAEDSGSSVLTLPSHLQHRLPSLHLSSEADLTPAHEPSGCTSIEGVPVSCDKPQENRYSPEDHKLSQSPQQCILQKEKEGSSDLNDIWMKFACGDDENSEELLTNVFKEAMHQAAVEIRPSNTSGSADEHNDTVVRYTSELSFTDNQSNYNSVSPEPSPTSHIATIGTTSPETTSSNIATVGSLGKLSHNPTRFVIPKSFVGKHVNMGQTLLDRGPIAGMPREGNKRRGRRRKRILDGRTDIRSLPGFDGDPIEEIEDD